ncbi:MAG TPA: lytic transglycosylase domain-containing protein [Rhizobiaceae bacterium]|nr:lytic transglycosylase domain-containing protein [Rhizobiaceae bacterium]
MKPPRKPFLPLLRAGLALAVAFPSAPVHAAPTTDKAVLVDRLCTLISVSAERHGLPETYLARLIWKESRFDINAVSPVGAEGVAQFMPGTARLRGLENPFDPDQAIPASAAYLAEMRANWGNLGLAAIGYNAGEGRLSRWLASGGFLPLETEDYVLSITGKPADHFANRTNEVEERPLSKTLPFDKACRELPVIAASTVAMAVKPRLPWGIQVAGNFNRTAAIRQWERVRRRFPAVLAKHDPVVSRQRTPIGRRGIFAVRIGASSRTEADRICTALRSVGGACIVSRNR